MSNRKWIAGALIALLATFGVVQAQNDRLIIGATAEVSGFDPRIATDVPSFERINVIMEPLVVFDRGLGLQPRLATSWELADDLSSITFNLREGVTWHDGSPFTAADVRFTFETVLDPDFGALNRSLYTAIASIDTPDDLTVVFNLSDPNAFLVNNIARMPIVQDGVDATEANQRPIGTGPYKFVSQVRDDRLILERFDGYWGGAGHIPTIEFRVIPEASTRLLSLEAGEVDMTQGQLPTTELDRLEADPSLVLERTPGAGYTYLAFNMRSEPLDDVRVRQALNHLIPRQGIVDRVMAGNAFPGISMLLPTMPWFNPDVRRYDYDPELARQLLQQAGVDFDRPLRLFTNENNPARVLILEILEFEFAQIGLTLEVRAEEFGAFIARVQQTEDYDMFILGWGAASSIPTAPWCGSSTPATSAPRTTRTTPTRASTSSSSSAVAPTRPRPSRSRSTRRPRPSSSRSRRTRSSSTRRRPRCTSRGSVATTCTRTVRTPTRTRTSSPRTADAGTCDSERTLAIASARSRPRARTTQAAPGHESGGGLPSRGGRCAGAAGRVGEASGRPVDRRAVTVPTPYGVVSSSSPTTSGSWSEERKASGAYSDACCARLLNSPL
jgi:peptide/nickel transport system substrate-binding protein